MCISQHYIDPGNLDGGSLGRFPPLTDTRVANPIQSRELVDYRLLNFVSIGLSIGLPDVFIDWIFIDGFLSIIDYFFDFFE